MSDKQPRDLGHELHELQDARFGIPAACMIGGFVIYFIWWILTKPPEDQVVNQVPCVALPASLLAVYFFIKFHIRFEALQKYLDALKQKRIDEAVEFGKVYYSINRKGFSGLDGHGYDLEDEQAIEEDIEMYYHR